MSMITIIAAIVAALITAQIMIPWICRRLPQRNEQRKRRPF